MRSIFAVSAILLTAAWLLPAADIQGVIVDWSCAKQMAQKGREKTLKQERTCSLAHNYQRPAYGLLTSDNKYYRLDDAGNKWASTLLKDSPDKDNLYVVARGNVDGNIIHVTSMTEL